MARTNRAVLEAANYTDVSEVITEGSWSLLRANSPGAFEEPVDVLFLGRNTGWTTASEVRSRTKGREYHILVWKSSRLAQDLSRTKREFGGKSPPQTVDAFLTRVLRRTFRIEPEALPENPHFVEPTVRESGSMTPAPAISKMTEWLTATTTGRVGVLLAPAGEGKTTVARELDRQIASQPQTASDPGRIPLLVESDDWAKLAASADLSLWDVLRASVGSRYSNAVSRDRLETFVQAGSLVLLFDGFDELCSHLSAQFQPKATLRTILELVENSEGSVLLTSRNVFWLDNLRDESIPTFQLLPFDGPQTQLYFQSRFPADPSSRNPAADGWHGVRFGCPC